MIKSNLFGKVGVWIGISKSTGKFFIGSSIDLARSQREFKGKYLKNNKTNGLELQQMGADDFYFAVLSFCDKTDLLIKRNYFINFCDNINQGFNIDRTKSRLLVKNTTCLICNLEFTYTSSSKPNYCSWECRRLGINKSNVNKRQKSLKESLKSIFIGAKSRAKKRKMQFNITLEFILKMLKTQKGKCAVTGVTLKPSKCIGRIRTDPNTITIDRIDSLKGYTEDNIQLVTMIYNTAKSNFEAKDVIFMAKKLLKKEKIL